MKSKQAIREKLKQMKSAKAAMREVSKGQSTVIADAVIETLNWVLSGNSKRYDNGTPTGALRNCLLEMGYDITKSRVYSDKRVRGVGIKIVNLNWRPDDESKLNNKLQRLGYKLISIKESKKSGNGRRYTFSPGWRFNIESLW